MWKTNIDFSITEIFNGLKLSDTFSVLYISCYLGGIIMKRIISICLCILLLNCMLLYVSALNQPQISVSNCSASPGETVCIDVNISNNPGIIATRFEVCYDSTVLKLIRVDNGDIFPTETFVSGDDKNIVLFEDALSSENYTKNGCLVKLYFKVIEFPKPTKTKIRIIIDNGSTFDKNLNDVCFKSNEGILNILGSLGDLDKNGIVNSSDALIVLKHSVGLTLLDRNQAFFGDINQDDNINSLDALIILKYAVGLIEQF